jgi:hypothetical protein
MSDDTQPSNLIPEGEKWMDLNLNVMLVGLHGVGKTAAVMDLCQKKELKLKYFSCSTLDPFVDLVGVPFARNDENGDYLEMVRQRNINEAEIIFFDEFNRADPKVHNAVFEIIQFHTLNGEPLPNLRMVWAAMNPPNQDYDVEELDPALVDRFDCYQDVQAMPSPQYMVSRGIRLPIAQALCQWWTEQDTEKREEMITPRRLEKIGHVYENTGDFKPAIPLWFKSVDRKKLHAMLIDAENRAEGKTQKATPGSPQSGPYKEFQYTDNWIEDNAITVSEYLSDHQDDLETHQAVMRTLRTRTGVRLAQAYGPVLNSLTPSVLEGLLSDMPNGKLTRFRDELNNVDATVEPLIEDLRTQVNRTAKDREL